MKRKRKVAIIIARGGSKRIPRKNIRPFAGKPLISYSILAAIESHLFDEVMVSTEDKEIAELSVQFGAKVPFYRSEKNASDFSPTVDVLLEVIEKYKMLGVFFDQFCCLYPTAPFITPAKLKESYEYFDQQHGDFCISITNFLYPPQRKLALNEKREIMFTYPEHLYSRSQDLEEFYHDVGQFYWGRTSSLMEMKSIFGGRCLGYILPAIETQDIDNLEDWEVAEFKYRYLKNAGRL